LMAGMVDGRVIRVTEQAIDPAQLPRAAAV
jgi:hypothetical protein